MTALATTLIGGGSAAWALYSWTTRSEVPVSTAEAIEPAITVLDTIGPLLPGQSRPVRIMIENHNHYPVRVTKIDGGSPATGDCPAWAVRVARTPGSAYLTTLSGRSRTTVTVRIGMEKWADQKCAGKRLVVQLVTTTAPA